MSKLRYLIGVGTYLYGFAFFGLLCLLFIPFVLPLILLPAKVRSQLEPMIRAITHRGFGFVRWHCRVTGFADMRLIDHRQGQTSPLLIANHLSMFDIVLLFSFMPGLQTLVNSKFVANPLLWPIIRACGYIPVKVSNPNDGVRASTDLNNSLQRGQTVVMFPEGTRSADGHLGALKQGPFRLAKERSLAPSFVFFTCNQPFLNRAAFFPRRAGAVILEAHIFPPNEPTSTNWRQSFIDQYEVFRSSELALEWNRFQTKDCCL